MIHKPDLDPEIRTFITTLVADWACHPPLMSLSLPQAREVAERVRARWTAGGPVMHSTLDSSIPTASGQLAVRVYHPRADRPLPALIYLHGGGFTLFSIDTHDRLMREYAARGGFAVIGVDYPLSPEAKYPTALDQIVDLVRWLGANGAALGVDPTRLALGGDSAGANLTLATCLRLRDAGEPERIAGMLLNYGAFTSNCSDEAEAVNGGPDAVLNREEMNFYFSNYVSEPSQLEDPLVCPGLAELAGLPSAMLIIPERDLLAEQSIAMVERMERAGLDVSSKIYPGATHSFLEAMSVSSLAREAIAEGAEWLSSRIG